MPSSRLPEIRFARSPKRLRIQTEQEHQQLLRMEENQVKVQEVQQLQQMVSAVQASVDDYEARRQSMIQELKSVTVELAVAVAAKLLMREVNESEQFVEALVSEQLQSINQGLEINVALSSGDFQALEKLRTESNTIETGDLKFHIDPTLKPGDCRIENGSQQFVSSLQTKLSEIRQHLLENLNDAETERRRAEIQNRGIRRFPDRRATG